MSSRSHSLQIRRYRALQPGQLSARSSRGCRCIFAHSQLSTMSSQGHALAPNQLSIGPSRGLVPDVLYSPSLCIRLCNSCTVTLTACLCNVSPMFHFFWYCFRPTKYHTGYKLQTAYGPTHWIGPPTICLH